MKIGIDISQLAYSNTGVANYFHNLLQNLIAVDEQNEYILFYSSLRRKLDDSIIKSLINSRVKLKKFRFPPILLDLLWNKLHIAPIEWFVGDVDVFITSDWTEPPVIKAKKVTILYDLIVYKYPQETTAKIIKTQKSKLKWVRKEADAILCISESTKKDASEILGIDQKRLHLVYPGV
ncbi:MAG: hypothetical protein KatS3mg089_0413 [Patescibacteria group bacterium]|nr:MAG: hypothetical protein KatS3mg089_0413 [Patescibacteria group bacterium]